MARAKSDRTIAVANGIAADKAFGAVAPPLYLSSNFAFSKFEQSQDYEYSRTSNPTRDVLADTLAKLEGGSGAVVTPTGMSAIHLPLSRVPAGGLVVAPHDCYGGTCQIVGRRRKPRCASVNNDTCGDERRNTETGRHHGWIVENVHWAGG
ncbi:PLP-dependent transferase [Rhizobium sp. PRIMUS64]|nr:PLP-dependent transferase [Rhizobium sp. PRIMUS64]MCJ9691365.1 PLP-dependent transferase [Rhizobium sp. PRIMUS64]